MFLPDANIWLALSFEAHVHHSAALEWFEATQQTSYFCRLTQQAFLRLATNPKAVGEDVVSLRQAWQMYDDILADSLVAYSNEPARLEARWRAYTDAELFTPKIWSDAYLAAFAQEAHLEIVTFDRGFRRYTGTACIILQP